jgi:hypothetical protein
MVVRARIVIAALYLLFAASVYVGLSYADPGWAEGGIPLLIAGLPSSILVLVVAGALSVIPGVGRVMATEGANFLMFVVLCGGINAALILRPSRVIHWFRNCPRGRLIVSATIVALVGAAQVIMPIVDRDALERSRPRDVPKDAVHVGGAIGWWQHCTYDPARRVDDCLIWNRGGLVLEEGEFVAYDQGGPATIDQLQIADSNGSPQIIALRNGRLLIPKGRQAELTRFLDWKTGKRQTR